MTQIPSKTDILAFIADNPTQAAKRDIARAFGIKGADRVLLKQVLREMEAEGLLAKRRTLTAISMPAPLTGTTQPRRRVS